MQKFPSTKDGMAKRRAHEESSQKRNGQFNSHNGEPHTAKFLAKERAEGKRRPRNK